MARNSKVMRRFLLLALLLPLTLPWFAAGQKPAVHWPGWLGPNRDAQVSYFKVPDRWPDKLQRDWELEVGTGYSTPIVADGAVYQHARQGEEEVLIKVDLETGKSTWRKAWKIAFKIGSGGDRHGKGPKSNPVYDDGRVFTMSINGSLRAWDAKTGEPLWHHVETGHTHPYWGTAASPLVADGKVIVHVGSCEQGALLALDAASGKAVWRNEADPACYSSPVVTSLQGTRQLVEWNHNAVVGIDLANGKELWRFPFPHRGNAQNIPTPAIHDGKVLAGGEDRGMHCVVPTLRDGKWSVDSAWFTKDAATDHTTPVVNGGRLFGLSQFGRGTFYCLDIDTGKVRWKGPGRTGANATFLSVPGHVLALTPDGELRVFDATADSYKVVKSYQVAKDQTWAPPTLLPDGLLIKGDRKLYRLSFPKP